MRYSIGCSVPSYQIWVGDGYCDDDTNTAECQWDGGDCCGPDVYTYYCSVCACHEDSETTTTTVATTPTTTKTPIAIGPGTKCYNLSYGYNFKMFYNQVLLIKKGTQCTVLQGGCESKNQGFKFWSNKAH